MSPFTYKAVGKTTKTICVLLKHKKWLFELFGSDGLSPQQSLKLNPKLKG